MILLSRFHKTINNLFISRRDLFLKWTMSQSLPLPQYKFNIHPNIYPNIYDQALLSAITYGRSDIAKNIIDNHNVDPYSNNACACRQAIYSGREDILISIMNNRKPKKEIREDLFILACIDGRINIIKYLIGEMDESIINQGIYLSKLNRHKITTQFITIFRNRYNLCKNI